MATVTDNNSGPSDSIGLLSSAAPRLGPADARPPYNPMDRVREDARLSLQPESTRLADVDAADRGDKQLTAMKVEELGRIKAEADQALSDLADTARALGADDVTLSTIDEINGVTARAQEYGRAVKAAAECGLRRGI